MEASKGQGRWKKFLLIPLWVASSFSFAQLLVALGLYILEALNLYTVSSEDTVAVTLVAGIIYSLTLGLVVFVPVWVFGKARVSRKLLGLGRLPNWIDIILTPAGAVIYLLTVAIVMSIASSLFPSLDLQQAQDVGFSNLGGQFEYILAFITLIIIAPLAEEVLFRGYLYGKLRTVVSFLPSILMTSLIFGAAHMQWNVAIDTFVLSLILCSLREITGSIWAGVLLHMLKNGVAFYFIFINPSLLSTLGG